MWNIEIYTVLFEKTSGSICQHKNVAWPTVWHHRVDQSLPMYTADTVFTNIQKNQNVVISHWINQMNNISFNLKNTLYISKWQNTAEHQQTLSII